MLLLTSRCKSHLHNKTLLFGTSTKPFKKEIKTKLMLCKPLFIIRAKVKGFSEVILEYKNEVPQLQKWGHGTCIMRLRNRQVSSLSADK